MAGFRRSPLFGPAQAALAQDDQAEMHIHIEELGLASLGKVPASGCRKQPFLADLSNGQIQRSCIRINGLSRRMDGESHVCWRPRPDNQT
jgi:hypothetical protein